MTAGFVPSFSGVRELDNDTAAFSKKDFLSLPEVQILNKINESLNNPDNFIGAGHDASVYRISDEPYCVRRMHKNKNKIAGPVSFELTQEDKINHVVAKLSDGTSIMKYLEGYPPYLFSLYGYNIKQTDINKILEEMPVIAFQNFIRQIGNAKQNDMFFDCGWGNVVVNPQNNTITAIDFYTGSENFYNDGRILQACYSSLVYPGAPAEHKKTCAAKLMLAALEEMKPDISPCMDIRDINISSFLGRFCSEEKQDYPKILKNILQEIEKLKLKDLYNKSDSLYTNTENELNGKIKVAQFLIKQTLLPSYESNTIPVIDDKEIYNL